MKRATVFILMGQSNAVGHGLLMSQKDKITVPLKNVFGLSREKNQSFDITKLSWDGYTSADMNLGEEQDDTYSVCNLLATHWQRAIDDGARLPDLYIVHIAIGAQGITEKYMWYPFRERRLKPGRLGTVDISLYPFSMHILSLLKDSFDSMNIDFDILGLHWRGGEEDTSENEELLCKTTEELYVRMINDFSDAVGVPLPFVFHTIECEQRVMENDPTGSQRDGMNFINSTFCSLAEKFGNVSVFDPKTLPIYNKDAKNIGLFESDLVHFTREANELIALKIMEDYLNE